MSANIVKVTLEQTRPPVWRRIALPEKITYRDFHEILQIAFGWDNYHLHDYFPPFWRKAPMGSWKPRCFRSFYYSQFLISFSCRVGTLQSTWRWVAGRYSGLPRMVICCRSSLRHQWMAHSVARKLISSEVVSISPDDQSLPLLQLQNIRRCFIGFSILYLKTRMPNLANCV